MEDDDDNDVSTDESWIEELECALLADCDVATIDKITEGRRIPNSMRPQYWMTLLSLNDSGKVKLSREFNLPNQSKLRQDCEQLVEDIAEDLQASSEIPDKNVQPLDEAKKLKLKSYFETTVTTYVKARPELSYSAGNGWMDILKVLSRLNLNESQLYQIFFRIVDRYIPRNLVNVSTTNEYKKDLPKNETSIQANCDTNTASSVDSSAMHDDKKNASQSIDINESTIDSSGSSSKSWNKNPETLIQAYHLLRLLIQYHDPELCSFLDTMKVLPNLYSYDWFCSLFARSCSPDVVMLIWDTHYRMGDPFLVFFAAIVMVVNARDELKKQNGNKNKMLEILASMSRQLQEDDIEDLYYLLSNHYASLTPRSIRAYGHLFFMDVTSSTYATTYENFCRENQERRSLVDQKTAKLTNSLDLSQYLCLPIVPSEIFLAEETNSTNLSYFLVDCRPAEQYNAGHLTKAFHLDCSLLLSDPSAFNTAVQALLDIQRRVVAQKSSTGGQHVCFIGSGSEEDDRYVNMVVASFLQRGHKYVSIVIGGFDAIHKHMNSNETLFQRHVADHQPEFCKTCRSDPSLEAALVKLSEHSSIKTKSRTLTNSSTKSKVLPTSSFFANATANLLGLQTASNKDTESSSANKKALSSAFSRLTSNTTTTNNLAAASSMFDKFATVVVSKSNEFRGTLVESLNNSTIQQMQSNQVAQSRHVSHSDKLGPRYIGSAIFADEPNTIVGNETKAGLSDSLVNEEFELELWQKKENIIASFRCSHLLDGVSYAGYIAVSELSMWILHEIAHNKGFANVFVCRALDEIVQITRKRNKQNLIVFKYGKATYVDAEDEGATESKTKLVDSNQIAATDQLQVPQSAQVIELVKEKILEIRSQKVEKVEVESNSMKKASPVS